MAFEEQRDAWDFRGVSRDDPRRIKSPEKAIERINEIGFLPLLSNEIDGFSLSDWTYAPDWWSDDPKTDPWIWREIMASSHEVAYGKFFHGRAGFISLEWLPVFANYRRDGYDFDALYDDGKAKHKAKKIMDVFETQNHIPSYLVKQQAGFGKGGEKNYSGVLTELEMKLYLVSSDFQRKRNALGEEYGWPGEILATPEYLWGYDAVTSCYREAPQDSWQRIVSRIKEYFPEATKKQIMKVCK